MSDLRVVDVARELGLTAGSRSRLGPCPACGASRTGRSDKRPPLVLGHGGASWICYACRVAGDAVDLVSYRLLGRRGREAGPEFAQVLAWLAERHVVDVEPREPVEPPAPRRAPVDVLAELAEALRACHRPADVPEVAAYLRSRAIDADTCPAGVLPASFIAQHGWWPAGWSRRWPLVVPAVDAQGRLRSLHARHVPGYGHAEAPSRKSTWPVGLPAQGLVFADPARARPWLQGKSGPPAKVLVVEGISDFLTVAGATLPELAILGIESGSAPAFADMPWVRGQAVYLATDPDLQGHAYADQIRAVLPPAVLSIYSVPLRELARAAA